LWWKRAQITLFKKQKPTLYALKNRSAIVRVWKSQIIL
jgi:hypothetical protein